LINTKVCINDGLSVIHYSLMVVGFSLLWLFSDHYYLENRFVEIGRDYD